MSDNPQQVDNPAYYVSAIEIRLATNSHKTIGSIKVYRNDEPESLRNVKRTLSAGEEHREEFEPPLPMSLQDYVYAVISYSTKYRNRAEMTIDINLEDDEYRKEKDVRLYRKKRKNVEVVIKVHPQSPELVATTTQIIQGCSRFRVLIIGNTGVGKSSLVHKVFGVESVHPSQNARGEADIEREFTSMKNQRLVVHDSLGFEAGDEGNMEIVKGFVSKRKQKPMIDQLHAIWLCLEIPYAGGRLLERGVERFLERRKEIIGEIPLVVVLTKVDLLDGQLELDLGEGEILEDIKLKFMHDHCINPLHKAAGNDVTHVTVSTMDGHSKSLSDLLKATDLNMIKYKVGEAPRIMATIAQRVSIKEKIELSISIGKKKYWNTLMKGGPFRGRTLDECFRVIRMDIIQVWNFSDPDQYLMNDKITNDLLRTDNLECVTGATTSSNDSSVDSTPGLYRRLVGSQDIMLSILPTVLQIAFSPLKVYDVYQEAKKDVKILMAYIVDLICVMQIIFLLASDNRVTEQTTAAAVARYERTRKDVHQLVEAFDKPQGVLGGRDDVLSEIERLIWHFGITDDQIEELRQTLSNSQASVTTGSGSS